MRLFIVSDSHGDLLTLETILKRADGFDTIIHLGDGATDLNHLKEYTYGKRIIIVRGNCDSPSCGYSYSQSFKCGEKNVFICHGHTFGVKYGLTRLSLAAREKDSALCLFGHTHTQLREEDNGVLFFNPGSVKKGQYGIIEESCGKFYPVELSL